MTQQNHAWFFGYPGIDMLAEDAGIRTSLSGCIEMIEEPDSVRQAVLLLLSTCPGERVMRPEYGCDLHRLVFSPNDDTTAGLAIHYARKALETWEPRIEILRLDAKQCAEDAGRLDIILEYRVRTTHGTERIVYPVYLTEG
jgi:phage baseplate assembly protein W